MRQKTEIIISLNACYTFSMVQDRQGQKKNIRKRLRISIFLQSGKTSGTTEHVSTLKSGYINRKIKTKKQHAVLSCWSTLRTLTEKGKGYRDNKTHFSPMLWLPLPLLTPATQRLHSQGKHMHKKCRHHFNNHFN